MKGLTFFILALIAMQANANFVAIDVPEKGVVGKEFMVYIDANISGLDAINYTITFPSWVEILEVKEGEIGNITIPVNASSIGDGKCSIVQNIPSLGNVSGNGYLAVIKAKAMENGIANFNINGIASDRNGNEINLTWINASIKIYETMLGINVTKEASKNSTIFATIELKNVKNINAANFDIEYENIEFINASSTYNFSFSEHEGKIKAFILFGNESGNLSIAMLKFKCTNAGEAKIMLKNVTLSNINASRIEAYIENATITVFDNFAPVANFSYLPSNAAANETVTFNASMSYDSDGSIVNYTWDFGDGSTGYGCIVNHSYASNGAYNVTLLVKDDDGAIASIKKIVIIWVKWDINMDGRINILDLILIGQHWNEHGKRGWIRADVNDDGVINVLDMILVATHWTG